MTKDHPDDEKDEVHKQVTDKAATSGGAVPQPEASESEARSEPEAEISASEAGISGLEFEAGTKAREGTPHVHVCLQMHACF